MNDTALSDLISWRLQSQQLTTPGLHTAAQVFSRLGAIQAQDYEMAKWSIGLRMQSAGEAVVEQAIANHEIVRSWSLRGTLHFLAAEDVHWLNGFLAPMIIAGNQRRYRQLELDETDFATSHKVLQKVLAGGKALTRTQIAEALESQGVSAKGQRAPYLLQRATFEDLICHGPLAGRDPTYVLLDEWIQPSAGIPHDEALARLAQRYFSSHGPASLQDFAWWSGLKVSISRQGLETVRSSLASVKVNGEELWAGRDFDLGEVTHRAHILPPFDEYLLGYKDRSLVLDPAHTKKVNAGGGMPKPAVLLDGMVAGIWKRSVKKNGIQVSIEPFDRLEEAQVDAIQAAARRYAEFYGKKAEVILLSKNSTSE